MQPISHRISEMVQDRAIMANGGHTDRLIESRICGFDWYQNHRPWMTLNDLERIQYQMNFRDKIESMLRNLRKFIGIAGWSIRCCYLANQFDSIAFISV